MAGRRQLDAEPGALLHEEAMRDLGEDAAAVAKLGIGTDRAAMVEIVQDLQALLDDRMGLAVLHVGDEADAAGVLLIGRIIETLALRHRRVAHRREGRCRSRHARLAGSAHRQTPLARSPGLARPIRLPSPHHPSRAGLSRTCGGDDERAARAGYSSGGFGRAVIVAPAASAGAQAHGPGRAWSGRRFTDWRRTIGSGV